MITGYNWPVISLAGRPTVIGFSLRCFGLHQHRDLVLLPHWQLLGRFCLPLSLFLTNQISGELSPTDIGGMESSKQLSQASCNPWICFDLFFQCSNTWGYTSTTNNEQSFATWHKRGWTKCGKVVGCLVSWFSWKSSRYGTADFGTVFRKFNLPYGPYSVILHSLCKMWIINDSL